MTTSIGGGGAPRRGGDVEAFGKSYERGEAARHYRDRFGPEATRAASNLAERRVVRDLLGRVEDALIWLDLPSGAGRMQDLLSGRATLVVGADASLAMLQLARDAGQVLLPERALADADAEAEAARSAFVRATAFHLPFRDGAFDGVLCMRFLHHFRRPDDRIAILAELRRIARRCAVVSFFDAASLAALRRRTRIAIAGRPRGRFPVPVATFRREAAASGWRTSVLRYRARFVSEWVAALLLPTRG